MNSGTQYDKRLPKHCITCGSKMKRTTRRTVKRRFDNGDPMSFEYLWKCKKLTGFRARNAKLFEHDSFHIIETPFNEITKQAHRTLIEKGV